MSLLMDALRKAEESKKKVASKAPSESESSARQSASPAAPAMPGRSETPASAQVKATSRDVPPDETGSAAPSTETRKPASRQPIPDLAMEFDEDEAVSPSPVSPTTPTPVTSRADDPGDAAAQVSKESPAITADDGQSGATRELMDSPQEAADQDATAQSAVKPDAAQFELTPKEQTDSRQPLDTDAEPDYSSIPPVVDKPGEKPDDSPAAAKRKPALALEVESPELPAVQADSSVPDASKSRVTPEPAPQGKQQNTGSSIRERSAGRRASARSVFTAKKPQQLKRRQQLLFVGGGVVTVLLLGLGTVYYLNSGSSSGITVPDNYVANQDFSSGEIDRGDDAMAAEVGGVVQQDAGLNEPTVSADGIDQQLASSPVADDAVSTPVIIPPLEPPIDTATAGTTPVSTGVTTATTTAAPTVRAPAAPVTAPAERVSGSSTVTDSTTSAVVGSEPAQAEETQSGVAASSSDAAEPVATASLANNPGSQSAASADAAARSASPRATSVISFSRRQPESAIEPQLNQAYAAFQQGDFSQARALYESVLIESPLHRDALLGLAAIAVENLQPAQAMDYYSRLLARNPNDPVARAALLELSPAGGPAVQERELRRLQERHPGVAPLAYSMGNFYASRQQWTDAQQHYFRALQLAKSVARESSEVNPDYAFNLAVSLEHLNQGRAALSFYREALEQSDRFPASFDIALVRNRIDSLSRTPTP